jgi:hypothetical protein
MFDLQALNYSSCATALATTVQYFAMHSRRLDDRIRELCGKVAATSKTAASNNEVNGLLQELLCAVHEKIERLRILAAKHLVSREPCPERRATPTPGGKSPLKP